MAQYVYGYTVYGTVKTLKKTIVTGLLPGLFLGPDLQLWTKVMTPMTT